jgi:hypothetical protein
MKVRDFLQIHKARENTRAFMNLGPYYILDHYNNIVVASKISTMDDAKQFLRELRAKNQQSG